MEAPLVTVEVHLANGLPSFTIVGLPDTEVKEAKDRVRAALQNARFDFPTRRITVNLAPADLPKEGGRFDLPIALGILAASGQLPAQALTRFEFAGELALTGELRPIRGALAMTYSARESGRGFVLPTESAEEAALVRAAEIYPAQTLLQVCAHLAGREALTRQVGRAHADVAANLDMSDVKGQMPAKRALEIAAAGGHSVLMTGPPGTGKTMLAERLPGILPPMTDEEALASAAIQSLGSGGFRRGAVDAQAVPRAAPYRLCGGPGRRRQQPAAGRDLHGPERRAVSRRAAGVRPRRARSPARAARVGAHHHLARCPAGRIPGALPARRGDEPVSVRFPRPLLRQVSLRPRSGRALSHARSPGRCSIASICTSRCRPSLPTRWPRDLAATAVKRFARA